MTTATEVGKRVREIRERRNMTQADLAAEMKTTQSVVSRMEAGANLTLETLQAVATATGTDLEILFNDPGWA